MLIDQPDLPGFPVFDTTSLHVQALVDFALGNDRAATPAPGAGAAHP